MVPPESPDGAAPDGGRRAVLPVLREAAAAARRAEERAAFDKFDTDKNGELDASETREPSRSWESLRTRR